MTAGFHEFCPSCFDSLASQSDCQDERCLTDSSQRTMNDLPLGTSLGGLFLVGRVLGRGGFGITYLGWDQALQRRVAIKEYLPTMLAGRGRDQTSVVPLSGRRAQWFEHGLAAFLQEARTIAQVDHRNVVRIHSYLHEHGTAYLVMEFYRGMSLSDYAEQRGLSEADALEAMRATLEGLEAVHELNILHRDIKPANIYFTHRRCPILIDFGAARTVVAEDSQSYEVVFTPGYTPPEQYHRRGRQGPWTDVYACGATLYYLLSGVVPPSYQDRVDGEAVVPLQDVAQGVSPHVARAVHACLEMDIAQRPQSAAALRVLLAPATVAAASGARMIIEDRPAVSEPEQPVAVPIRVSVPELPAAATPTPLPAIGRLTAGQAKAAFEHVPHSRLFVGSSLPPERLGPALAAYAPGVSPADVVLLYDNTFFGGSKHGFLLTTDSIYWRNMSSGPKRRSYDSISNVQVRQGFGTSAVIIDGEALENAVDGHYAKVADALAALLRVLAAAAPT